MQYTTDDEGYVTCGLSGLMANYDWVHIYESGVWRVEMPPHVSGYFESFCRFKNFDVGGHDSDDETGQEPVIPQDTNAFLASDLKIEFSLSDKDEDLINSIFWVYNYQYIRSTWKSTKNICNLGIICAQLRDRCEEIKYSYETRVKGDVQQCSWSLFLDSTGVPEGAYFRVGDNWLVIATASFMLDEL